MARYAQQTSFPHRPNTELVKWMLEPARSRTWNLLIRSQTRYPLRHWPEVYAACNVTDPRHSLGAKEVTGKRQTVVFLFHRFTNRDYIYLKALFKQTRGGVAMRMALVACSVQARRATSLVCTTKNVP